MASKRELAAEAETLGKELGVEVSTRDLNFQQLTEVVERLRTTKLDTPKDAPEDKPADGPGETKPELDASNGGAPGSDGQGSPSGGAAGIAATTPPDGTPNGDNDLPKRDESVAESCDDELAGRYRVAAGRSITAQHGLMSAHEPVLPRHFPVDVFRHLLKIGAIEKVSADVGPIE